jgi:hypothetical protein
MAKYIRDYPTAPSAAEIKTGYAPSTIRGTPFVKFLFWTFAGLAITFAITWGATSGLNALEEAERARHARMLPVREVPFEGPRLQPSRTHPTLDFVDMAKLNKEYYEEKRAMGFEPDPRFPDQLVVSTKVLESTGQRMARQKGWQAEGTAAH